MDAFAEMNPSSTLSETLIEAWIRTWIEKILEMRDIIAWIFGIGAMISLFLIYQQKTRKKLLLCKLCADVCWVIHYICLGAYGGAIPNFVGIFREMVFVRRENSRWANCPVWPFVFIAVNLSLGISTFHAPVNILPVTASVFVTISLWLKKPRLTKMISVPVSLTFLVYDMLVGSWIGVINESAAIVSLILFWVKERKNNERERGE